MVRVTTTTTPAVVTCSPIQEGTCRTCRKFQPTSSTVSASGRSGGEGSGTSSTRVGRPSALSRRTSPRHPASPTRWMWAQFCRTGRSRPEVVPRHSRIRAERHGGARQRESDSRSSRRARTANHGHDLLSVPWCPGPRIGSRISPRGRSRRFFSKISGLAPPARLAATPARTRPGEHPLPRSRHRLLWSFVPEVESFTKL